MELGRGKLSRFVKKIFSKIYLFRARGQSSKMQGGDPYGAIRLGGQGVLEILAITTTCMNYE